MRRMTRSLGLSGRVGLGLIGSVLAAGLVGIEPAVASPIYSENFNAGNLDASLWAINNAVEAAYLADGGLTGATGDGAIHVFGVNYKANVAGTANRAIKNLDLYHIHHQCGCLHW